MFLFFIKEIINENSDQFNFIKIKKGQKRIEFYPDKTLRFAIKTKIVSNSGKKDSGLIEGKQGKRITFLLLDERKRKK